MKEYPSIPRGFVGFPGEAYVFDKLDGSNLRFEWSRKQKWHKYGTRHAMLGVDDPILGGAIPLFHATLAEPLEKLARDQRWDSLTVFCEYYGPNSFAGWHDPADAGCMKLALFDLSPLRIGIVGPKDFLDYTEELSVHTPAFLGRYNWTRGFVDKVWANEIPGITFEGVIGKHKSGKHDGVMAKAKTKMWIDKIHATKTTEEAEKLINS